MNIFNVDKMTNLLKKLLSYERYFQMNIDLEKVKDDI